MKRFFPLLLCSFSARLIGLTWSSPPADVSAAMDTGLFALAVNDAGEAIVVYEYNVGPNNYIYASIQSPEGSWSVPVQISNSGSDQEPYVAIDPSGNAVAIWSNRLGFDLVDANSYTNGMWQGATTISDMMDDAYPGSVGMDSLGNATAVWSGREGVTFQIQFATKSLAGGWTMPDFVVPMPRPANNSSDPRVAIDPSGNAVVVWRRGVGVLDNVEAAARPFGGSWTVASPPLTPVAGMDTDNATVGIDAAGNAVAAWRRRNAMGFYQTEAAVLPFGGVWGSISLLSANPMGNMLNPRVSVSPLGNAIVIWEDGAIGGIEVSTLPSVAGAWSPKTVLDSIGADPWVAMDSGGNAFAVWRALSGGNIIVQSSFLPLNGAWEPFSPVSDNVGTVADRPAVGGGPSGYAVAAWGFSPFTKVQSSYSGTVAPSVTGLGGSQLLHRFASQGDLVNTLVWDAAPGAAYYRIYRDSGLTELAGVSFTNSFEDHQRQKGGSTTYYVVSVNSSESQGAPAVITVP